jgi:LuxR family transcriptional regulator, transcriptional regulator of spore coat protein
MIYTLRFRTIEHITNVMKKLNVKGRSQAVVELVRLGELNI